MDLIISNYLNNLTTNEAISKIIFLFSDFPIFFIPIFLLFFWIINIKNVEQKKQLINIFYSCVLVVIVSLIIQKLYFIDRPMSSLENAGRLILKQIPNASFPSDHAGVSSAFLSYLFLTGYKKYFFAFLPFFIIMDLSRIAGGVHWASDILAGIILGFLSAYTIYKNKNSKILINLNNIFIKTASYLKL